MSDNEKLEIPALNIHTTTTCTLNCAKCGSRFPDFRPPLIADKKKTMLSLDKIFQIFTFIREVRFAGAEAFLYDGLGDLLKFIEPYSNSFQYGIIVTNGTYTPPGILSRL